MKGLTAVANSPLGSKIGLDIVACVAIALSTGVLVWILSATLSFTIDNIDVWLDTDSRHVFDSMTNRWSIYHGRNNLHPLFSFITYPLVFIETRFLGISAYQATRVVSVISASAWSSLMYITLRLMNRPFSASLIFTGIALSSTTGLFFLPIVERYVLGSVSMLVCVAIFVAYERQMVSEKWLWIAAAGTLGITITNFMVGIAALFLAFGPKKGLQSSINAFFVIAMLSMIQCVVFPASPAFLKIDNALRSTAMPEAGTTLQKVSAFLLHAMVIPEPGVELKRPRNPEPTTDQYLSVERVSITRHRIVGYMALSLWIFILTIGTWNTYKKPPFEKVDILLGLAVLGQFGLSLVFGTEVIMYSLHYIPLILLIVSRLLCCPKTLPLYVVSLVFLCVLLWNNIEMFLFSLTLAFSVL